VYSFDGECHTSVYPTVYAGSCGFGSGKVLCFVAFHLSNASFILQSSVAKATLIIYVSGFLTSFANKYINKFLGRYVSHDVLHHHYYHKTVAVYVLHWLMCSLGCHVS